LLEYQNFLQRYHHVLRNYFDGSTKLFSDLKELYVTKFLDTSAKPFFLSIKLQLSLNTSLKFI